MTITLQSPTHPVAEGLSARARRVIPGGMYGHQDKALLWRGAPQFVARAEGARFWDVDGHEYVDLMCSWGPILHGYRHPMVEDAVARQMALVDCGNGPSEVLVELAELFVDTVDHAQWAMFAKNGSDVTTLAVTIARAATGRKTILVAQGAYHGALPWCNPNTTGVIPTDRASLDYYPYNDLASVEKLAAEHGTDFAGIIVSPFKHDAGFDQELCDPEFARGLRRLCDAYDAVLILDDVRAGLRQTLGCSWEPFDVKPDLSAWGKAIGNGYPIAALLGSNAMYDAARAVFATGSFWMAAGPMAAAVATINLLREEDGVACMFERGNQLVAGLRTQATHYALPVNITGPAAMPYLSFAGEERHHWTELWAAGVASRGVFLHPRHNWFLSTALTEADLDLVLAATDASFRDVAARYA
jgi:glutamate-1-semialdehyde 2,1-aminomutase